MQRIILIILLGLIVQGELFSQRSRKSADRKAMVSYVDGSKYIGDIIDENGNNIQLMLPTGDTISCKKDQAHRLITTDDAFFYNKGKYHKKTGIGFSFDAGFGANGTGGFAGYSLNGFYRYNPKLEVGIGVGLETHFFDLPGVQDLVLGSAIPWYLYSAYYLTDGKARFYTFGKVGTSFRSITNTGFNVKSGFKFEPGIGVSFASKRRIKSYLTLSQNIQYFKIDGSENDIFNNPIQIESKLWSNRLTLKFGSYF